MARYVYVLLGAVLLACAAEAIDRRRARGDEDVVLRVENNNWSDMRIYLLRSGVPIRIGFVSALSERAIALPRWVRSVGEVQIQARPIASRLTYTTEPILIGTGREVRLTLEEHLPLSAWSVR